MSHRPTVDSDEKRGFPTGNFALQPTSLIDRTNELESAQRLLRRPEPRLLTLIGAGGCGKTRLGIAIAQALTDAFADGIFFVSLGAVERVDLVSKTLLDALGLQGMEGSPPLEVTKAFLRDRQVLLLLDNFEHVMGASLIVVELLAECPELKILITSREPLNVRWEQRFLVSPLPVPARTENSRQILRAPSVELFVQRALAVHSTFSVTPSVTTEVAEICRQLDGLPLAIELAAARTPLLSTSAILSWLDPANESMKTTRRLDLLTSGPRDLPKRQRTLRDTLAWSYSLLNEAEKRLFRRLSVFVGGCPLGAVESVCDAQGDLGVDVISGIASLVDKHLLKRGNELDGEQRFFMLETIREFGIETLVHEGEMQLTRRLHAAHFLELAERAAPHLLSGDQLVWLDRLDSEYSNIRSAMKWCHERGNHINWSDRFVVALQYYWILRSHVGEGRESAQVALERLVDGDNQQVVASINDCVGVLAFVEGDNTKALQCFLRSNQIYREIGNYRGYVLSLGNIGLLMGPNGVGYLDECEKMARSSGIDWDVAFVLNYRGMMECAGQDYEAAKNLLDEGVDRAKRTGDRFILSWLLHSSAIIDLSQGNPEIAEVKLFQALDLISQLRHQPGMMLVVLGLGIAAGMLGDHLRAAELIGVCSSVGSNVSARLSPNDRVSFDLQRSSLRAVLGESTFERVSQQTSVITFDEAVALARRGRSLGSPEQHSARPVKQLLSTRETEVAALVAQGLANREIADRLVIGLRTVETHVENILNKLAVSSRVEIAAWFIRSHAGTLNT